MTNGKIKYRVVSAKQPEHLEELVNILMDRGWQCQGGVAVCRRGFFLIDKCYVQAMTFVGRPDPVACEPSQSPC